MRGRFGAALAAVALLGLAAPAEAKPIEYRTFLYGAIEVPNPTGSEGTGDVRVTYDPVTHELHVEASFSGLTGTTTAAHIHASTALPFEGGAGVATQVPSFVDFPLGVTSGSFSQTLDLTLEESWNPAFISDNGGTTAGAEAALGAALASGRAYFNIHTSFVGTGEIRGFLRAVPEPSTVVMAGVGAAGLAALGLRHRVGRARG